VQRTQTVQTHSEYMSFKNWLLNILGETLSCFAQGIQYLLFLFQ